MAPKFCNLKLNGDGDSPGLLQKIIEFRAAAMLSGPNTHVKNFGLTAGLGTLPRAAGTFLAPPVQRVAEALTGQALGSKRTLGEAVERNKALADAFYRQIANRESLPGAIAEFGRATKASREILGKESPGAIEGKLGHHIRTPFRALQAVDNFFFDAEFSANMHQRAFRKAVSEGKRGEAALSRTSELLNQQSNFISAWMPIEAQNARKSLTKKFGDKGFTEEQVQDLTGKLLREKTLGESAVNLTLGQARELAERAVFVNREKTKFDALLNSAQDWMNDGSLLGTVGKSVFPFFRTTINATREFLRASPVGLAQNTLELSKMIQAGEVDEQIFDEIGRAVFGTMAGASVLGMTIGGKLDVKAFGSGDFKDKAGRDTFGALGRTSDSLQINFGDTQMLVPLRNLGEVGQLIKAGTILRDSALKTEETGEDPQGLFASIAQAFTTTLPAIMAEDIFADDISRFLDAANDDKAFQSWAKSFGGSFIPAGVKFGFNTGAETLGESRPVDELVGVPVGEQRLGLFGEPRRRGSAFLQNDPIVEKMVEVGALKESPSMELDTKKEKFGLDQEQKLNLGRAKGMYQKELVSRLVAAPGFDTLPKERQKLLIDKSFDKASRIVNKRARAFARGGQLLTVRNLVRGLLVLEE